tara:strand:+ start:1114 stop:1293 length:180 start_codon:yes stop_codon:yes gene_type:complete
MEKYNMIKFLKTNRLALCLVFMGVGVAALVAPRFARKLMHDHSLAERNRVSGMVDKLHK